MKTKRFLYIPLLFLIVLFGLDKIFLLPYFDSHFLQTGNVVYYKHREILFEKLKSSYPFPNKKLMIAMGDSRAYAFSSLAFSSERKSKYTVYNFSGPQAVMAYSLFWLEKFIENNTKPDLVFLVLSPEGYDDAKNLMHKPFLRLGADENFIKKYKKWIPGDDWEEYELDQFLAIRKKEFDIKLLMSRFKSGKLKEYNPTYNPEMQLLMLTNGEQLAYTAYANDEKRLQRDSDRMAKIYLHQFKVDNTQFLFLEEFLRLAKENNIQVQLIWPRVYKDYRKELASPKMMETWWKRVLDLSDKYKFPTYNFNEISDCDLFYDASHQSTICYEKQINFLVDEYEKSP